MLGPIQARGWKIEDMGPSSEAANKEARGTMEREVSRNQELLWKVPVILS
jgi:hypothetical protein